MAYCFTNPTCRSKGTISNGGLERTRRRADAPTGLPLRVADPRPRLLQAPHPESDAVYGELKPMIGGTVKN